MEGSRESPAEDPSTISFPICYEPEEVFLVMPKTEPDYLQAEESIKEEYPEYHDIKQKICTKELKSEDNDILYKCADLGEPDSIIPGNRQFMCSICNKEFSSKSSLVRHTRIHNKDKEFQCDICLKGFSEKCSLKIHLLTHSVEKPFECPVCNRKYSHPRILKKHVRVQHTKEYEDQLCTVCGRHFVDVKSLEVHLSSHIQAKKYTCRICSRDFAFKSNLNKHYVVHYVDKVFECPYCKRKFSRKDNLKSHIRVHTYREQRCPNSLGNVEKLCFECPHCKKNFGRKSRLNSHLLVHTGERKHICTTCGKAFSLKGNLSKHLLVHSNEKKYPCPECCKKFRRIDHLKSHLTRQHANTNQSCRKSECEAP